MDDDANAQAARPAPYDGPVVEGLWIHFTDTPVPVPLGIYREPATTFGVLSVPVESSKAARALRDLTSLMRDLEEMAPGARGLVASLWPG